MDKEKIYIVSLVFTIVILIFVLIFLTYRCPNCKKTYEKDRDKVIIYTLKQ